MNFYHTNDEKVQFLNLIASLYVWSTGGKITDEGIKAIAASCPGLTSLNVLFTYGNWHAE